MIKKLLWISSVRCPHSSRAVLLFHKRILKNTHHLEHQPQTPGRRPPAPPMGYEEGDRIPAGTCDNWDAHVACSARTPPKAGRQCVPEAAIPCVHVCGAVCRGRGTYHVCTLLEVPLHLKQLCSVCPGPARSVSGAGRGATGRQPSRGGRGQEAQQGPSVRGQQRPRPAAPA